MVGVGLDNCVRDAAVDGANLGFFIQNNII